MKLWSVIKSKFIDGGVYLRTEKGDWFFNSAYRLQAEAIAKEHNRMVRKFKKICKDGNVE